MLKTLILSLLSLFAHAATTTLTPSCPTSIVAGQTATVSVSLAGGSGLNIAGAQFTVTGGTVGVPVNGAAASGTGKAAFSALNPAGGATPANSGNGIVLVMGATNATVIPDGILATVPVTLATVGTASVTIGGIFGADSSGRSVNGITGGSCSIAVTSQCTVTGGASVTVADVQAVINAALGLAPCNFPGFSRCTVIEAQDVELALTGGACVIN